MGWLFARKISQRKKCSLALYYLGPYCVHCTPALCSWSLHEHAHEALMSICARESFMSMLMKLSRARACEGVMRTTTIGQYASWLRNYRLYKIRTAPLSERCTACLCSVSWFQNLHHWNANFFAHAPILLKYSSFYRYWRTDFKSILIFICSCLIGASRINWFLWI